MKVPGFGGDAVRRPSPRVVAPLLALAVFLLFLPVGEQWLIPLDDGDYLANNPAVRGGLSADGLSYAFRTFQGGTWHPLTWLSHMADATLFGEEYGRHHLASAALHGINAAVLFLALNALTGSTWRSLLAALLFGVHPLQVQSVAWLSERKNLLSTLFAFLALGQYAAWARTGNRGRYALVVLCFALALMSKSMVVTLPFVLLLLDFWPLRRLALPGGETPPAAVPLPRLLLEKAPLLLLSGAMSALTFFLARDVGQAVMGGRYLPLPVRAANAATSYATYLRETAWPASLSILNPLTTDPVSVPAVAGAALLLLALTAGALLAGRRFPHLPVGWLWFAGTLLPVSGIVQAGSQLHGDRYMYLPVVGLLVAAAWSLPSPSGGRPLPRRAAWGVAVACLLALAATTRVELSYWRDGSTLFRRAVELTNGHHEARENYGQALTNDGIRLLDEGKAAEALPRFEEAARIFPWEPKYPFLVGVARYKAGMAAEAVEPLRRAVATDPANYTARYYLGVALVGTGRESEGAEELRRAFRDAPPGAPIRDAIRPLLAAP